MNSEQNNDILSRWERWETQTDAIVYALVY